MDTENYSMTEKRNLITAILMLVLSIAVFFAVCQQLTKKEIRIGKRNKSGKGRVRLIYSNNCGENLSPKLIDSIKKCCAAALDEEEIGERAEVSLTIVDNEEIRELNNEFRGKDSVTDVLSFPMGENGEYDVNPETNRIMLGDIVISAERAMQQAEEYGHSFEREMCFLATHSMFHLLGYDHEVSEEEEKIMFQKQSKVLDRLGIVR